MRIEPVTKTLAELQALCSQLGIAVPPQRRPAKESYLLALRDYFWEKENPGQPLPEQIGPILLGDWNDLDDAETALIEMDQSGWCVQEKHDGVRVLLHVTAEGVRITGRTVSEVTFRLSEFQANLPHLTTGFENLAGTVLDGELVCPRGTIDTGDTVTTHSLQAAVAILATSPENAKAIQEGQDCRLRFVAFDVLRFRGIDATTEPLRERLTALEAVYLAAENPHLGLAETHTADKALFHQLLIAEGKEGSVYKRLDRPYEPGRRVRHWIKRKKAIEVEAVVTGFKPGTAGKGNAHLVGAVEFSAIGANGVVKPIAWVSNWTDEERERMTRRDGGNVTLDPTILGKKALVGGHDIAGKSGRYRHARLIRWLDAA
jgi:ATP-dependent DNA ligase